MVIFLFLLVTEKSISSVRKASDEIEIPIPKIKYAAATLAKVMGFMVVSGLMSARHFSSVGKNVRFM